MSLIEMIDVWGDEFPFNGKFDSYDHSNKFHEDDTIASLKLFLTFSLDLD